MTDRAYCQPYAEFVACDHQPCPGHRVTKDLALIAEFAAWCDGYIPGLHPTPDHRRQQYLDSALEFISTRKVNA